MSPSVLSVLRFPWIALERLTNRADLSSLRNLWAATPVGAHIIGSNNSVLTREVLKRVRPCLCRCFFEFVCITAVLLLIWKGP